MIYMRGREGIHPSLLIAYLKDKERSTYGKRHDTPLEGR